MSNQYLENMVNDLKTQINSLKEENKCLTQTLLDISTSVEQLNRRTNMLEDALATKADINHIR